MIEFNCLCKQYKFSVPPDMAGTLVQCPTCRRLMDVPTLSEMEHLDEDGGYKFQGESTEKKLDTRVAARAYTRARVDEFGHEIDLRQTMEDIHRAGVRHVPGTLDGVKPIPPKYDPVTGELIRPLAIKDEAPQRVMPIEADDDEPLDAIPIPPPKLSYASVPQADMSLAAVYVYLLQPANVVVMGFAMLLYIFLQATAAVTVGGFGFVVVAPVLAFLGFIGHFGNVIDETGPGARDELPTPFRNVSVHDDIWAPFCQLMIGFFLAFLPLFLWQFAKLPAALDEAVHLACIAAGFFIAPALILTSVTSGTYLNLRPDRVLGVVYTIGAKYLVLCAGLVAPLVLYWVHNEFLRVTVAAFFATSGMVGAFGKLTLTYGLLAGAIFMMHAFCWQLGLVYRTYHDHFPWILQRHTPVRMAQRTQSSIPRR
jgi:hypothetical protein